MGSLVRLLAVVSSGLVLFGFAFFATDELGRGSQTQQKKVDKEFRGANSNPAPIAPSSDEEAARELANGTFREAVDDANERR